MSNLKWAGSLQLIKNSWEPNKWVKSMESGTLQADVGSCGICKQNIGGDRGAGIPFNPPPPKRNSLILKKLRDRPINNNNNNPSWPTDSMDSQIITKYELMKGITKEVGKTLRMLFLKIHYKRIPNCPAANMHGEACIVGVPPSGYQASCVRPWSTSFFFFSFRPDIVMQSVFKPASTHLLKRCKRK